MAGLLDGIFSGVNGLANTLITDFGTTMTVDYEDVSAADYDPATMTLDPGVTSVSYTVSATPPSPYTVDNVDGSMVMRGDMMTTIPSYQTPERVPVGATCTFDSQEWTVMSVDDIMSGNEHAAYRLQLRRQ